MFASQKNIRYRNSAKVVLSQRVGEMGVLVVGREGREGEVEGLVRGMERKLELKERVIQGKESELLLLKEGDPPSLPAAYLSPRKALPE